MMPSRAVEVATAALVALFIAAVGHGQTLATHGDRFTLNGQARFLVFISYFDGIRRIPDNLESTSVLDADFDYLARHGLSGIRVFANWQFRDETLMDCSGSLRRRQLDKLVMLIDRAAA